MTQYLIIKDGIHVATANSSEEADELYLKYEADEIREFENDCWMNMLADE